MTITIPAPQFYGIFTPNPTSPQYDGAKAEGYDVRDVKISLLTITTIRSQQHDRYICVLGTSSIVRSTIATSTDSLYWSKRSMPNRSLVRKSKDHMVLDASGEFLSLPNSSTRVTSLGSNTCPQNV